MNGYAIVEGTLTPSKDYQAVEAAMVTIKARLDKYSEHLSLATPATELERVFRNINQLIGVWNENLDFLHQVSKLRAIEEAKNIISELKWPPDELPRARSSS